MLSAIDISLERHFEPVFNPVSFELSAGELMVLTGDNGSGKTTLMRIIAGLIRPSAGRLERRCSQMRYLGHALGIKDDLDVVENLRFVADLNGAGEIDVASLLRRLALERVALQAARTLSAGQRKRCAMGRLLAGGSDLWLLDEPYSNLDDAGVNLVDDLLRQHLGRGGACVMATHGARRPTGVDSLECRLVAGRETRS